MGAMRHDEGCSNWHNLNYSIEDGHITRLNMMLGRDIQHARRKLRADGVKAASQNQDDQIGRGIPS